MAIAREQVVQAAEKYVARGKIEAAIREYKKVLAENPNDTNTLNRVGDLYARIQRIDEAVDFFTQIAQHYTDEGFFVKAIAIYKKIIKLNPTQLEVYEKLAELYHKQGLVNEARTQYHVLADYYIKHENPTSAIAIYLKMAELEPENPTYHVKLAELYQQQKLTEKALAEHRIIAELMIAHGHPQEAAQVYERALDIDSSNVGFLTDAVMKLKAAGHTEAAKRLLGAAVERNPQAEKIGRLAGFVEESAPAPAPAPVAAAAPVATPPAARQPAPSARPEAAPEAEEVPWGDRPVFPDDAGESGPPAADRGADFELELDLDADLSAAPWSAPAPPAYPATEPLAPEGLSQGGLGHLGQEEFDLDLDEVFVLDIEEDEEEPASLVKPPPDMLGEEVRRPAWAQSAGTPPPAAGFKPDEDTLADPAGLRAAEKGRAAAVPAPAPAEADEEVVLDLDLDAFSEGLGGGAHFDLDDYAALPGFAEAEQAAEEMAAEALPALEPVDLAELAAQPELPALEPEPAPADILATEPAAAAPGRIDPDLLERTAAELHPQVLHREEDLVSEAEVLAKYGLEDKALERLREALRLDPRHLGAMGLMIQLHLDKGRHARVAEMASHMARVAAETGALDREAWQKIRRRLLSAGYRLEGGRVVAAPAAGPARPAAPAVPAAPLPPAAAPAAGPARRAGGVDDLLRGLLDPTTGRKAPAAPRPSAAPPEAPPAPAPPPVAAAPPALAAVPPAAPPLPAPEAGRPGPAVPFNPLEIGQMVDMADLDEAPDFAGEPLPPRPAAAAPTPVAPPPPVAPEARRGLEDTGVSWLDEVEAGRSRPSAAGGESALFAGEEDFFDLAGELEEELSKEAGLEPGDLLSQPVEQSLEQIVEGFKKGVAENLSPTDYDTHFNLGIAYREMGLIDEAIGEFQLAAKSPQLLVTCCSMLGLCFLEKGLPELAVKWYRRGLEAPQISEEDSLGLLYDLGNVYESMGDRATAYKTFVELYGINTNYRDVVARIEDLGR